MTSPPTTTAAIPHILGGRYQIVRELGIGTTARVYLARDRTRDRLVALKMIRRAYTDTVEMDRFRREIGFAARLQHPHVLSVVDSGTADGLLWYTMPYVAGGTVRDRVHRDGPLPVVDAVRLARETASALAFAHGHGEGVLHRDVKPENILLDDDGRALLADFGIARALNPGGGGQAALTAAGMAVGTPAYISPEQAAGERALDGRTDVYALGCVLYEMLAGASPFTGPTPQAVIAKRFATSPDALATVRADVPPAVEAVVMQAMARAPADRFQTADALVAALIAVERQLARTAGGRGRRPIALLRAAAIFAAAGALLTRLVRRFRGR